MENLKTDVMTMLTAVGLDPKTQDLKDIKDKKGTIKEERTGFLIYSKKTIDDNPKLKGLYNEHCKKECKERNLYRYYYYEKLEDGNQLHATIIMMNPAFADSENSDGTIQNIKKYLHNEYNKFGSFDIVNLYPIRMPKSAKLKYFLSLTKDVPSKYQKFVQNYLEKNCKNHIIIAAWASEKGDNKKAEDLFKKSNIKFYCYGLTKDGFPRHFSSLAFNNFNKFRYPFPFIKINNWLKSSENFTDYDKTRQDDVKNMKNWLTDSPKNLSIDYVDYMSNLLKDYET